MVDLSFLGKKEKKPSEIEDLKTSLNNVMSMYRDLDLKVEKRLADKNSDNFPQKEVMDAIERHGQYINNLNQRLMLLESGSSPEKKPASSQDLSYENAFKKLVEVIVDLDQQMKPKPAKEKSKAKAEI